MFAGLGVTVALRQAEIDDVNVVLFLSNADEEVIWLYVSVQEVTGVHELDALEHLVSQHEHGLQRKLALAVIEEILEGGAQEVEHHHVVVSLDSEPVDVRNSDPALEYSVELGFVEQLGVLGSDWLELNGDLFVGLDVGPVVNISKSTATELS